MPESRMEPPFCAPHPEDRQVWAVNPPEFDDGVRFCWKRAPWTSTVIGRTARLSTALLYWSRDQLEDL